MAVKKFDVSIEGTHPLLVHGTAGLDPTHKLNQRKSELTGKRGQKKTESDLKELDWIDFQLSLYHDGKQPVVPDTWILGTIHSGAKSRKMGREALAGIEIEDQMLPLEYDGPKDVKGLYDKQFVDRRVVAVQKARIMRTRPRFTKWAVSFNLLVEDSLINPDAVKTALEYSGKRIGIGDFRPRFGRFEIASWKEIAQ